MDSAAGRAKAPRTDVRVFEYGASTETRKRAAIFRALRDRVASWTTLPSSALPVHIAALRAQPVDSQKPPMIWIIGCQPREQSWTTTYWLQCQKIMLEHTMATAVRPATPFLRVEDGFFVTTSIDDMQNELGTSLPATFLPAARKPVSMVVASRVPGTSMLLQQALRADTAVAQIRATIAAIQLARTSHGLVMRHVVPHNLWARELGALYDGVSMGSEHVFSADELAHTVPQLWPDLTLAIESRDLFALLVPFTSLRDPTDKSRFVAPALDMTTAVDGQCLISLCAAMIVIIINGRISVSPELATQLAALLPTEAQLLDLAEAAADNSAAAANIQRYMAGLLRLRRAVLRLSVSNWSIDVARALWNVAPPLADGVLPLHERYMPSFRSALDAVPQPMRPEVSSPLSVQ